MLSEKLSLRVETKRDELKRITAVVEDMGRRENWPSSLVFRVNLVLEEMGLNIMDNAFDGGLNEFDITLTSDPDSVTIEIIDDGRPFDPLNDAPPPDVKSALEDRPVGGLGIHFVRSMTDELVYRREQGKNHLTLLTYRTE